MNEEFSERDSIDPNSIDSSIDTELQVRLMNLVMGEASDFERDQLQSLMEQRADLATYYKHIERLHGLLSEVGTGDLPVEVDPSSDDIAWQLPADRRAKILAVLDTPRTNESNKVRLANKSEFKRWRLTEVSIVALALTACVLIGLMLHVGQSARGLARKSLAFQSAKESRYAVDAVLDDPDLSAAERHFRFDSEAGVPKGYFARPETFAETVAEAATEFGENDYVSSSTRDWTRAQNSNEGTVRALDTNSSKPADSRSYNGVFAGDGTSSTDQASMSAGTKQTWSVDAEYALQSQNESSKASVNFGDRWIDNDQSASPDSPRPEVSLGDAAVARTPSIPPLATAQGDDRFYKDGESDKALRGTANTGGSNQGTPSDSYADGKSSGISSGKSSEKTNGKAEIQNPNEIKQKLESLVETYNDMMDKRQYAEAEQVAKQVATLDPNSSTSRPLSADARTSINDEKFKLSKEEGFIKSLNDVDRAATPSIEDAVSLYPNTQTWEALSNRRKSRSESITGSTTGPTLEAGQSPNEVADVDSLRELVQQPVESDSFLSWVKPESKNPLTFSVDSQTKEEVTKLGKSAAGDFETDTSVAKNMIDTRDGEIINRKELENSERRLKASQIFETTDHQSGEVSAEKALQSIEAKDSIATLNDNSQSMIESSGKDPSHAWMYTPVPSPEVASSTRGRSNIDASGKLNKGKQSSPLVEIDATKKVSKSELPSELMKTVRTRNEEIDRARKQEAKQAKAIKEQSATSEPFSTFSLHVSDVAFKLAATALAHGQWPDPAKIRIEEFVNALDYHDPLPTGNQKVACRVEQAIHPFLMQRNLLRVSMRTAATGRAQNTPLRLTLLLDNSGSMERPDRRQAVMRAFQTLTQQLNETDQVTLISFASTPRLLADKLAGNRADALLQLIEDLPSEGGTNIEAALILAREKATEQQVAGAQNRIVLLTDGAVNLGNADPQSLAKLVTQMRDSGIAFDAAGISAQDLNDEVLEALTRQGDGRYYLLDSAESVGDSFAAQIAGALRPSAQNVKVQVEFNPQRVGHYKLLGFEKHRLNKEDFHNDKVDAAEMAAAETGVAVYQFEIKPNGSGDVGSVSVRFRDLSTGQMIENRWPIPYESQAPRLEQSEPSMQLAASTAMFAAKLSGGSLGDTVDLSQLQKLLNNLPDQYSNQPRVQQLRTMINQALSLP